VLLLPWAWVAPPLLALVPHSSGDECDTVLKYTVCSCPVSSRLVPNDIFLPFTSARGIPHSGFRLSLTNSSNSPNWPPRSVTQVSLLSPIPSMIRKRIKSSHLRELALQFFFDGASRVQRMSMSVKRITSTFSVGVPRLLMSLWLLRLDWRERGAFSLGSELLNKGASKREVLCMLQPELEWGLEMRSVTDGSLGELVASKVVSVFID